MLSMFDSVTVSEIPSDAPAVAGYVGGRFPDFSEEVARFPHAHHLSIAVNAGEDAECLDVENGDAIPGQAPGWVKRQQARGVVRPVVYSSVSEMPAVLIALAADGIARENVRVWTAHFTGRAHLCSSQCGFGFHTIADATQWTDHAFGRNLDQSLCQDEFFTTKAPPAQNKIHYEFFQTVRVFGKRVDEAKVVRSYDRLRKLQTNHRHPHRVRLAALRVECWLLARRIDRLAHPKGGKVSYKLYHRGYRRFHLWGRAQGQRFV